MSVGDSETIALQTVHERRHDARGDEIPHDFAVLHAALLELKNHLRGNRIAFHARYFAEFHQLSTAVAHARQLDDQIDSGGDLLPERSFRQINTRHQHHGFQTRDRVSGGIGVDRADGTVMAGVHRLHHVKRLAAAHLADDDSVRAHSQRVANQIPLGNRALPLDIGGSGFQPHDVLLLELELRRVLDRDDALILRNVV